VNLQIIGHGAVEAAVDFVHHMRHPEGQDVPCEFLFEGCAGVELAEWLCHQEAEVLSADGECDGAP
jgi:hypothetical protein